MSTDYQDLITNLTTSIHDDLRSARTRVQSTIEVLERATVSGLRTAEQRLVDRAQR